jgi:hypothetical protein
VHILRRIAGFNDHVKCHYRSEKYGIFAIHRKWHDSCLRLYSSLVFLVFGEPQLPERAAMPVTSVPVIADLRNGTRSAGGLFWLFEGLLK